MRTQCYPTDLIDEEGGIREYGSKYASVGVLDGEKEILDSLLLDDLSKVMCQNCAISRF